MALQPNSDQIFDLTLDRTASEIGIDLCRWLQDTKQKQESKASRMWVQKFSIISSSLPCREAGAKFSGVKACCDTS